MQIKIEITGGNGKGESLEELVKTALKKQGYNSYTEFAELVAEKSGAQKHAEVACVSRVVLGQTKRIDPDKAKIYAEILKIPAKTLLAFGAAGKFDKPRPIILDDGVDITKVVKKLAAQNSVTMEDLIKEFLYLTHQ